MLLFFLMLLPYFFNLNVIFFLSFFPFHFLQCCKTALRFTLSETVQVCIINSFAYAYEVLPRTHPHTISCEYSPACQQNIFSLKKHKTVKSQLHCLVLFARNAIATRENGMWRVWGGKPNGNSVFYSMYSTYKYHKAFKNCPFSFNLTTLEYCNNRSIWCRTAISERSTYLSGAYMHAMEGEKKCVMIIHCTDNENQRQKRFLSLNKIYTWKKRLWIGQGEGEVFCLSTGIGRLKDTIVRRPFPKRSPSPPISITASGFFHHVIWVQQRRWKASHY